MCYFIFIDRCDCTSLALQPQKVQDLLQIIEDNDNSMLMLSFLFTKELKLLTLFVSMLLW